MIESKKRVIREVSGAWVVGGGDVRWGCAAIQYLVVITPDPMKGVMWGRQALLVSVPRS